MQQPSIFTRIIQGEIPAHKIYEDTKSFAFLDINPTMPGHTLVIPKAQVDRLEDLPDEDYDALMQSVKKVARRMANVYGADHRICIRVAGFDVPHAHVHVLPCKNSDEFWQHDDLSLTDDDLAQIAQKLAF